MLANCCKMSQEYSFNFFFFKKRRKKPNRERGYMEGKNQRFQYCSLMDPEGSKSLSLISGCFGLRGNSLFSFSQNYSYKLVRDPKLHPKTPSVVSPLVPYKGFQRVNMTNHEWWFIVKIINKDAKFLSSWRDFLSRVCLRSSYGMSRLRM